MCDGPPPGGGPSPNPSGRVDFPWRSGSEGASLSSFLLPFPLALFLPEDRAEAGPRLLVPCLTSCPGHCCQVSGLEPSLSLFRTTLPCSCHGSEWPEPCQGPAVFLLDFLPLHLLLRANSGHTEQPGLTEGRVNLGGDGGRPHSPPTIIADKAAAFPEHSDKVQRGGTGDPGYPPYICVCGHKARKVASLFPPLHSPIWTSGW